MTQKDSNCKACDEKRNSLPQREIAGYASEGNLTGALTSTFSLGVDSGTAGKIGTRLGGKPVGQLMSFIDTPGSNKQKRSMSDSQKKTHLINSVGLGNFSMNSTFESGLIDSIASSRGDSSNFLKGNKTGSSLIAASALGINVPGGNMLGIGSGDSSMFKLFKLAAFGLRLLCASLRGTRKGPGGYSSDTEEALGLLLSLSLNLDLFARLKAIFDKLTNLKFNFSSFDLGDLNIANVLLNLCDWVENMEYGSDTIDTLRKNFSSGLTNKGLTEAVGKSLIGDGTYDSFARNDFAFDQQFKSIAGDIDMLKCDACNLGKTDIKIAQGNTDLVNLEFDARTGLKRDTGYNIEDNKIGVNLSEDKVIPDISAFNSPVSQEEIDNYIPSTAESNVLKDLSTGEKNNYIKENIRAKRQLEQMKLDNKESGVNFMSDDDSIEYTSNPFDSVETTPPINPFDSVDKSSVDSVKKDLKVTDEKFSQKSISTQVGDATKKIKPETQDIQNVTELKKVKTVKSQLGIKEEEKIPQIDTTLDEVKVKPDIKETQKVGGLSKTKSELQSDIKKKSPTSHNFSEEPSSTESGISYESDNKNIVYDTYTDESGDLKEDTYKQNDKGEYQKTDTKIKYKKPVGGPPAPEDADEVTCFHSGETVTREELEGTILEDADMNAVGLLHPNDRENLKNTEEVEKVLADANKIHSETFDTEIEKTENLVLEQQSGGIIFGVQLPTVLNGNQIVMNSERVLISAKTQEVGIFSKRKFFVTTDDEITMNCKQRFVVKSDRHASFEAPTVHLGLYTTRNHPTLKGDCVMWWMNDLCDWLSGHTHSDPFITTGTPTQQGSLAGLKARTPTLLSERIFISG